MNENKDFIETIFNNIEKTLSSKIIYGEKIILNNITIIPISKAILNFGTGNIENIENQKDMISNGFFGNIKLEPMGFLIINDSKIEILNISNSNIDFFSKKIIDLVDILQTKYYNNNDDKK